jgi:hypothetical protein
MKVIQAFWQHPSVRVKPIINPFKATWLKPFHHHVFFHLFPLNGLYPMPNVPVEPRRTHAPPPDAPRKLCGVGLSALLDAALPFSPEGDYVQQNVSTD